MTSSSWPTHHAPYGFARTRFDSLFITLMGYVDSGHCKSLLSFTLPRIVTCLWSGSCPFCVEWTLITNRKDGGCPGGGCDETPTASIIFINLCEFMISFQSMDPFDKFIFVFLLYGIILIIIGTILFTVEFTDVCPATRHVRGSSQSCLWSQYYSHHPTFVS